MINPFVIARLTRVTRHTWAGDNSVREVNIPHHFSTCFLAKTNARSVTHTNCFTHTLICLVVSVPLCLGHSVCPCASLPSVCLSISLYFCLYACLTFPPRYLAL